MSVRAGLIGVILLWLGCGPTAHAQMDAEQMLDRLPRPAQDVAEALARCPHERDTLAEPHVQELLRLGAADTIDAEAALMKQRSAHIRYLARLKQDLDTRVRSIGEGIDRRIRDCTKVRSERGQMVYDSACVESAEELGRKERIAAVQDFLWHVGLRWQEYLEAVRTIVRTGERGAWQVLLRVATDAAWITATAAQFAR